MAAVRRAIPLGRRPLDAITYIVDLEQLVIADPRSFDYPVWPPARLVELVHWSRCS
jgi:hypothetical protein